MDGDDETLVVVCKGQRDKMEIHRRVNVLYSASGPLSMREV